MRIRNNKSASFALRYTGKNRSALSKSLEKLSSGYAINRAGDDAAGLTISEKMRRQVTGLKRADQNSREGSKLIQVGEGALDEIHSMLQRAASLANQSANGVYEDEIDREALQAELDELCDDIDRISTSANFNGIKLFQDRGLNYERGAKLSKAVSAAAQQTAGASRTQAAQTAPRRTLDDLIRDEDKGELNIVYFEQTNAKFETTQKPEGNSTLSGMDKDVPVSGGTATQKLSDILKTEIVPQTVQNILTNYPAFSYLKDSAIGIGLDLYSNAGSSVLASVTLSSALKSNGDGTGTLGYKLSVNVGKVDPTNNPSWREDLEATIAHEMIHAFMDEATTAGMIGKLPGSGSLQTADGFESWFIEGMAQTASGPDTWIYSKQYTGGGLQIDTTSTDAEIKTQIQNHMLEDDDNAGAVNYGTGYLACMYLGWAIAGGGNTAVDAANISRGLSSLLSEVIGGSSLDAAISKLTNNKFASTADFKTQFNAAGTEVTGFVKNLMVARGSNGRGGLASGDLAAPDLTSDTPLTGVKLFELNKDYPMVNNEYPTGYVVLTGGTTSASGVKPSDFGPAVSMADCDFEITGGVSDGNGGIQGISWDNNTKTLTVSSGTNITISMKNPTSGTLQNLKLEGSGGRVILNGVQAASLQVSGSGGKAVTYEGTNDIQEITVDAGKIATFATLPSGGQLKVGTFTNDGTVNFNSGAVIVGGGTGSIGGTGTVRVNGGSVAANITPTGTNTSPIDVDWSKLTGLSGIASISVDGGAKTGALLSNGELGKLWLNPASGHRVTFTDANGVSKTLAAKYNTTTNQFEWAEAAKLFTVTGGTEGTDYHYESDGTTLVIDTDAVTSISGGTVTGETPTPLAGRVKLKDGIGNVNLTLDGVDCSGNTVGSGFDLGTGNNVTLELANGKENKFKGVSGFAGISLGTGTDLTINGDTGKLFATGGSGAAGIGRDAKAQTTNLTDKTSDITINGGEITATGSTYGAGIGAGNYNDIGNITITGGTVTATGGSEGGAGIGGANYADCGDILIDESSGEKTTIVATSNGHGAGIGGGWWDTVNGTITISAGDITAESKYHGTGIGAGCQGGAGSWHSESGKITITGTANIIKAKGGDSAAGIGGSCCGTCTDIEISGKANVHEATGGNSGCGIGSGSSSTSGNILIDTEGVVNAYGGNNGVGIGSGYNNSTVGNIEIKQGTVHAKGSTNATGIGAGRNSTSGNITIGDENDPDSKVIVTAEGGMTNNGGNIMAYGDAGHNTPGKVIITGSGTTVRPGNEGEGLYSTSGVVDKDDNPLYAYPVYLFHTDGATGLDDTLNAGVGLNAAMSTNDKLPLDETKVNLASIKIYSDKGGSWNAGLSHTPLDSDYVFVWLKPEDQKLTIKYEEDDGTGTKVPKSVELDLKYYPTSGVFRIAGQPKPEDAVKPGYDDPNPKPTPDPDPDPDTPSEKEPELGDGGIILQIGAEYGETLTVPQFYLSLDALKMGSLNISTQTNAWESMPVIQNAINRVSSIRGTYGALYNRLEHNQNQLRHMVENTADAESRIRDADMAEEMMAYTKANILSQSAQAMLAQAAQQPQSVLQLLS